MNHTEYLNEDETMVVSLRPHKLYLAPPFAGLVAAVAVVGAWSRAGYDGGTDGAVKVVAAVFLFSATLWFVWSLLEWHFTRFHLTSQRVLMWSGVLARRRVEIPLDRVNTVFVHQSIPERMLRCGRLAIESAGEAGQQTFPQCPRPLDVKQAIHRQKTAAPPRPGSIIPGDADLASQLERIAALRDQGVLDEWEFDDAKSKAISRYGAG